MKSFGLHSGWKPKALIFDLDSTLYTNPAYAAHQEEVLLERLGYELGIGVAGASERISALRAEREKAGLRPTSLARLFAELGFDIPTSVSWREEEIEPSRWLVADILLNAALKELAGSFDFALVTNNPSLIGVKSLEALGVRKYFPIIVGLDTTLVSKPAPEPFREAARQLGIPCADCLSIGDRYDVDIVPALEIGMAGILVSGVEEVYDLPMVLLNSKPGGSSSTI